MFDIIFRFILMYACSLNYISPAMNMFRWKRKEAEVFEEHFSSRGEHTPESNSWSPNYQGCKSEICILGIEKHVQT